MAFLSGCKISPLTQVAAQPLSSGPSKKGGGGGGMAPLKTFTPEDFGAVGDGLTNDTAAFARMSACVSAVGGGTVILQSTTYVVGAQVTDPTLVYAYAPAPIMNFDGCGGSLSILGNGARLRCADGLRFGTFDPLTGLPTQHPMPYYGTGELASPYVAMITVQNCTGKVRIENLELDGNVNGLLIGGPRGDTGWQISASGLQLINNSGPEWIVGLHSHHHALDGVYIDGAVGRTAPSMLEDMVSEYNGRQGCSIVGGRNYSFRSCQFKGTGKSRISSAPGAGVDIEAESSPIRNLSFSDCEFSNNSGAGLVADSGDSQDASFDQCRFVGTTSWSAWPRKPGFRFSGCEFVGSISNAYGDQDPARAVQFDNCSFRDDPALSPTGQVFKPETPIADLSDNANVLFNQCTISLDHEGLLPWSVYAIYVDSTMSQAATTTSYPRGTFKGTNVIKGNVDLYGSKVLGQLTVNGQTLAPTG